MSVKTKLARQAVKTTAKHTAQGATSKLARKPLRSLTLLALGAVLGGIAGWLIGRSGNGGEELDPIAQAPVPESVAARAGNSSELAGESRAVS